jgi:hypothetical protein
MSSIDFNRFLQRLSSVSEQTFIDPAILQWPEAVDPDAWYFSPELISIYGSDVWNALDERQQKRLSLTEAVNFFSLNIHGEKYLISEIGRRLYDGENSELSRYLLHFIEEESKHMMYFSGFCMRYAPQVYPDRTLHGEAGDDDDIDMFMLFARINVFEEIVDHYNKTMAKDERLAPIAREINRIHHVEESRHLAFGRSFLKHCLENHIDDWDSDRRAALRQQLSGYLQYMWKQYYNPDAYEDAGIDNAFEVWQSAADAPAAMQHRADINNKRLAFLRGLDLLEAA